MSKIKEKKTFKFHIKTGDTVKVLSGNSKGKEGKVVKVDTKTYRAVVEGANLATKHVKPSAKDPEGGIKKVEAPIHISNLMLVDPKTKEVTRVGRKEDEAGKLRRYSVKTKEFID